MLEEIGEAPLDDYDPKAKPSRTAAAAAARRKITPQSTAKRWAETIRDFVENFTWVVIAGAVVRLRLGCSRFDSQSLGLLLLLLLLLLPSHPLLPLFISTPPP